MPLDSRLENYLATLDRVLRPVPASERADIVMEIKSHVLSAMDRDPQASLDSVLSALGEPETVANRYLLERGLKPAKPPISPVVKWLVIGGLGVCALFVVALVGLVFAFSPVVKVSEKEGRVVLLGGLIDIDESKGSVKVGEAEFSSDDEGKHFEGELTLPPNGKAAAYLSNGRLTLGNSDDNRFRWDCRGSAKDPEPVVEVRGEVSTLDLKALRGARCELRVPKAAQFETALNNGRLTVNEPYFNLNAQVDNGRISIKPADAAKYAFDLKVSVGQVSAPPSAENPDYQLRARVGNGRISVED